MNPEILRAKLREIKALLDSLESAEISPELESALNDLLFQEEGTESNYRQNINGIVAIIDYLQTRIKRRKNQVRGLFQLIEADSKIGKCLEQYLIRYLKAQEIERLETEEYNLEIVTDSSQRELIIEENVSISEVPNDYQKLFLEIDRYSVRQALESGEELSFASLTDVEYKLNLSSRSSPTK